MIIFFKKKSSYTLVTTCRSTAIIPVMETYLDVIKTYVGIWQGLCVQSAVSADLFKSVHRALYLSNLCVNRWLCKHFKNLVCLREEASTMCSKLCCLMHGLDLGQTVSSIRQTMGMWHSDSCYKKRTTLWLGINYLGTASKLLPSVQES